MCCGEYLAVVGKDNVLILMNWKGALAGEVPLSPFMKEATESTIISAVYCLELNLFGVCTSTGKTVLLQFATVRLL